MEVVSGNPASLTIELSPIRLEEFQTVSLLRGIPIGSLLLQLIEKAVREEKFAVPEAFNKRFTPGSDSNRSSDGHPEAGPNE